ncbi:MAG: hypothetical protein EZS28_019472 [Streblomastix strix]|uniref:ENTH domain-containing protein n=1 Tax=Streblomastix strix TaxID=222440 RepID=A0A5J4VRF4_9EUKA|nr:MAG: hypothetical protein EZS28_019472 [Streblomastix strix]
MTVRSLLKQVQNLPVFGTEIERKIRFVTSNDRDVVDTSLLNEIADETHKRDFYDEIMQLVWERLDQKSKDWKIVYKTLQLMEVLIRSGSPSCITEIRRNQYKVKNLQFFDYTNSHQVDCGVNVREKAKGLLEILDNDELIKEMRDESQRTRERCEGGVERGSRGDRSHSSWDQPTKQTRAPTTIGKYDVSGGVDNKKGSADSDSENEEERIKRQKEERRKRREKEKKEAEEKQKKEQELIEAESQKRREEQQKEEQLKLQQEQARLQQKQIQEQQQQLLWQQQLSYQKQPTSQPQNVIQQSAPNVIPNTQAPAPAFSNSFFTFDNSQANATIPQQIPQQTPQQTQPVNNNFFPGSTFQQQQPVPQQTIQTQQQIQPAQPAQPQKNNMAFMLFLENASSGTNANASTNPNEGNLISGIGESTNTEQQGSGNNLTGVYSGVDKKLLDFDSFGDPNEKKQATRAKGSFVSISSSGPTAPMANQNPGVYPGYQQPPAQQVMQYPQYGAYPMQGYQPGQNPAQYPGVYNQQQFQQGYPNTGPRVGY